MIQLGRMAWKFLITFKHNSENTISNTFLSTVKKAMSLHATAHHTVDQLAAPNPCAHWTIMMKLRLHNGVYRKKNQLLSKTKSSNNEMCYLYMVENWLTLTLLPCYKRSWSWNEVHRWSPWSLFWYLRWSWKSWLVNVSYVWSGYRYPTCNSSYKIILNHRKLLINIMILKRKIISQWQKTKYTWQIRNLNSRWWWSNLKNRKTGQLGSGSTVN